MEIPAWLFFSFWALTSITFLHLSFNAFHQTHLSISVSPLVTFLLKHSLAISSCCSSNYALKHRPYEAGCPNYLLMFLYVILSCVLTTTTDGIFLRGVLDAFVARLLSSMLPMVPTLHFFLEKISEILQYFKFIRTSLLLYSLGAMILPITCSLIKIGLLSLLVLIVKFVSTIFSLKFLCNAPVFTIGLVWHLSVVFLQISWHFSVSLLDIILTLGTGDYYSTPEMKARVAILMFLEISLFFVSTEFSPILVIFVSHSISAVLAALSRSGDERLKEFLHAAVMVKESKMRRLVEFGVGIVGTIVFHYLFTLTSLNEVAALLYLAVMWLANLTLLGFPVDCGVFDFLLCNVVVGGVVVASSAATGVAYGGGALVLFGLRLKMESLTLEYEEGDLIQVQ